MLRTVGTVERLPARTTPRHPYRCINMYIKINRNYCSLTITLSHLHSKFYTLRSGMRACGATSTACLLICLYSSPPLVFWLETRPACMLPLLARTYSSHAGWACIYYLMLLCCFFIQCFLLYLAFNYHVSTSHQCVSLNNFTVFLDPWCIHVLYICVSFQCNVLYMIVHVQSVCPMRFPITWTFCVEYIVQSIASGIPNNNIFHKIYYNLLYAIYILSFLAFHTST
jgi:hypothetical protein